MAALRGCRHSPFLRFRLRLPPTYGTIPRVKTPARDLASPATIVFQSAKLGDLPWILKELEWAERLLGECAAVGRIFGVSGGNLAALAFSLALAAQKSPGVWGKAANAPADFKRFLGRAHSRDLRELKLIPTYGF